MTFVRTGHVFIGDPPLLEGYDDEAYFIREHELWRTEIQRVYGTHGFGSSRNMRYCFVLLDVGSEERAKLWVSKVFSIALEGREGKEKKGELAFVQYMERSLRSDDGDKVMRCVSVWWSITNDTSHTLAEISCTSVEDLLRAGECFGAELFCLIKGTVHVERESFAFQPFIDGVALSFRCFDTNRP